MGGAENDDCPARLVLTLGGDDARLSLRDRLFFEQVGCLTAAASSRGSNGLGR